MDPRTTPIAPQAMDLVVVYEDDSLLVVDKPAGLVVHPGSGNWDATLANALLHHAPQLAHIARAGIVHRLDKDTSGLLVVAKTVTAQTDLVRQLQARTVRREYLALATGDIERSGTIDAPIGRHPVKRTPMAVVATGKPSLTGPCRHTCTLCRRPATACAGPRPISRNTRSTPRRCITHCAAFVTASRSGSRRCTGRRSATRTVCAMTYRPPMPPSRGRPAR